MAFVSSAPTAFPCSPSHSPLVISLNRSHATSNFVRRFTSTPLTPLFLRKSLRTNAAQTITMVRVESTMLPLGTIAPNFSLVEPLTDKKVTLDEVMGEKGICVIFMCNHCPFVKHISGEIKKLGTDLPKLGFGVVGICSNDQINFPEDNYEMLAKAAKTTFSTFKYLSDDTQQIAKLYKASCTPDFYVFDKDKKLKYRGRLDDSRPGNNKPVTGSSLRAAVNAIAAGNEVEDQFPSMGCNIKWKPGNEPSYFG